MTRLASAVLQHNRVLEEAVAEDPDDDARWSVLEDWLLEVEDPRAILVRLEKAGRADGERRVRRRLYPQLLGPMHAEIASYLYAEHWRAGYLRAFHYGHGDVAPLAALCSAPAGQLCSALALLLDERMLAQALGRLAYGFARTLRRLRLSWVDAVRVNPRALGQLPRLERLELRSVYFDGPAVVPRIRELVVAPTRRDSQHLPSFFATARFPDLRELVLDVASCAQIPDELAAGSTLAPVVSRELAPALARIEIRGAKPPLPAVLQDALTCFS